MVFFSAGLFFLFSLSVSAQQTVIVQENDSSLTYVPFVSAWDAFGNPQTLANGSSDPNYFNGGGYLATFLPGATISLTFNGSYIAYYSDENNNHGQVQVTLDGNNHIISSFNAAGGTPQVRLFESAVDPNRPNHVITLTNMEAKGMGLDFFMYTSAIPTPPSPSTPGSGSSQTPHVTASSSKSSSSAGIVASATIAAIAVLAAAILGFLLLWRRRDRPASVRALEAATADMRQQQPQQYRSQSVLESSSAVGYPFAQSPYVAQPFVMPAEASRVDEKRRMPVGPISTAASQPSGSSQADVRLSMQSPPSYSVSQ